MSQESQFRSINGLMIGKVHKITCWPSASPHVAFQGAAAEERL